MPSPRLITIVQKIPADLQHHDEASHHTDCRKNQSQSHLLPSPVMSSFPVKNYTKKQKSSFPLSISLVFHNKGLTGITILIFDNIFTNICKGCQPDWNRHRTCTINTCSGWAKLCLKALEVCCQVNFLPGYIQFSSDIVAVPLRRLERDVQEL